MKDKIIVYTHDTCGACVMFKYIIEFLRIEDNFLIISSQHIFATKQISLSLPMFVGVYKKEKIPLDADLILEQLTNNKKLYDSPEFKQFLELKNKQKRKFNFLSSLKI